MTTSPENETDVVLDTVLEPLAEVLVNSSLDDLLNTHFAGKVVRKDLTKLIKEGANVPVYVLEYLVVKSRLFINSFNKQPRFLADPD